MQFLVIDLRNLLVISSLSKKKSQKQSNQLILIKFYQLIQKAKKRVFIERKTHAIFSVSRTEREKSEKRVSLVGGRELNL